MTSPFSRFFEAQGVVVLDGGLATTLESYGFDLDDPLWSARVLLEAPDAVRRVHLDFLSAGADCIATVTYQATHPGLMARGLSAEEADEVFRRAVFLAVDARDEFWSHASNRSRRLRPLVAGSIGPYGAFLADGSEYTGEYGLTEDELYAFHERRWRILADSKVDLLACETIPSGPETVALLRLLKDSPRSWAWISFSCRDGTHLADGTSLAEAARSCSSAERMAAVGANCVPASLVPELVEVLAASGEVPVVVYPNSGEQYDAVSKSWSPGRSDESVVPAIAGWLEQGVRVVGGCCRVTPEEVRRIRSTALPLSSDPG